MSTTTVQPIIIEWSPSRATAFDPISRRTVSGPTLKDVSELLGSKPIIAAISRKAAFIRAVRVPNAGAAEVDLVLRSMMETLVPIKLSELAYAFRLTQDVNAEGRLAVVAAMRASDLTRLEDDAKEMGVRIDRVLPSAFGSMLLAESLSKRDVAVLQRTDDGLAIDLIRDGELQYSRVTEMPVSTAAIEAEVGMTFAAVNSACSPTLAAGGFQFAEADDLSATGSLELLAGSHIERLGINLQTPETIAARERKHQLRQIQVAILALGAAVIFATYAYLKWSDLSAASHKAEVQSQHDMAQLQTLRTKEIGKVSDAQAQAHALERGFAPAQTLGDIATAISDAKPGGVWLTALNVERGKPVLIRGTATGNDAVADFLQRLQELKRLRDVKLVFATNGEIEKVPVFQFSISAVAVGNLPLTENKGARK